MTRKEFLNLSKLGRSEKWTVDLNYQQTVVQPLAPYPFLEKGETRVQLAAARMIHLHHSANTARAVFLP